MPHVLDIYDASNRPDKRVEEKSVQICANDVNFAFAKSVTRGHLLGRSLAATCSVTCDYLLRLLRLFALTITCSHLWEELQVTASDRRPLFCTTSCKMGTIAKRTTPKTQDPKLQSPSSNQNSTIQVPKSKLWKSRFKSLNPKPKIKKPKFQNLNSKNQGALIGFPITSRNAREFTIGGPSLCGKVGWAPGRRCTFLPFRQVLTIHSFNIKDIESKKLDKLNLEL